jgi:Protein of unknown function (DUF3311)
MIAPDGFTDSAFGGTNQIMDERPPRRGWQWLLVVPVVVPLLTFLYNGKDPNFLGFPRFYWLQLAFIVLGVATTTLVYQLTKDRR